MSNLLFESLFEEQLINNTNDIKDIFLISNYFSLMILAILKLIFELKRAEFEQKKILKEKWLYYNGKMDQKTLESKGWDPDPFDGLKILKGEMDYYYESDPEIQKSEEKIQYWKTTIDTLTEIIDNLKWRHQTISNIIKWKQFESGN